MAKKSTKFEMKLPIISTGRAKIVIDGIDITDKVKGVTIHAEVGELTEVLVTFVASVDLDGEAILQLRDCAGEKLGTDDEN